MKIAFIMDPLEYVKAYKDTSYFIMLAAQERGHQVYYLDQRHLSALGHNLRGVVTPVEVHADHDKPFTVGTPQLMDMAEMGAVFVRTDPPFDRRYFYTTLMLDLLPPTTVVVNRPSGLRNWNEKLAALYYADHGPETLVTADTGQILEFLERRGKITLKPVDGFGGRGIVFLEHGGANVDQLIQLVGHDGSHLIIAQEYIAEAKKGDKRVLLINGEPIGAVLRKAAEGKELNNLDAGGSAHPADISEGEMAVCRAMKEGLQREGIIFAGIDFLGEKLVEINVTSPTVLQELTRFSGVQHHHHLIEAVEAKHA